MPGPGLPWLDTWAPSQFVTQPQTGNLSAQPPSSPAQSTGAGMNPTSSSQSYDTTIPHKIAGTVILSLLLVFILQKLGFRFVVAANVGVG